jgi:hypothetical protein
VPLSNRVSGGITRKAKREIILALRTRSRFDQGQQKTKAIQKMPPTSRDIKIPRARSFGESQIPGHFWGKKSKKSRENPAQYSAGVKSRVLGLFSREQFD